MFEVVPFLTYALHLKVIAAIFVVEVLLAFVYARLVELGVFVVLVVVM